MRDKDIFEKKYNVKNLDEYQYALKFNAFLREKYECYSSTGVAIKNINNTVNSFVADDYVEDYVE